jgi:hypothetical protein
MSCDSGCGERRIRSVFGAKRPATELVAEFAGILTLANEKPPADEPGVFSMNAGCGGRI